MTTTNKKPLIKAQIKLMGRYYTAEGKTVEEVLSKLEPPIAKTVGVLTLKKGELERIRVIPPKMIANMWGHRSPTMKNIAIKNFTLLFSDFNK